jgi:hypothetical protein
MRRPGLDHEMVGPLDLKPVDADVLLAEVLRVGGIPGDDGGLVEVGPAVMGVEPEDRQQLEQVDVPRHRDLLPRRFSRMTTCGSTTPGGRATPSGATWAATTPPGGGVADRAVNNADADANFPSPVG